MEPLPIFPNYIQLRARARLPLRFWHIVRVISGVGAFGMVAVLFVAPDTGLFLLWQLLIPLIPLVFVVAPGLWRNMCPLAALNQAPRLLKVTRALKVPGWLQEYGYVIGFSLFFVLASSRKWLFNHDGPASAWLLLGVLIAALLGGVAFRGKSGWCSSICPLLPVQRVYNQTPFLTIANSHCTPCVGCTKNCYDFNPAVANLADLYDDDPYYSNYRKFFTAAFPGFILAFFTLPDPPAIAIPELYLGFGLYLLISVGSFYLLDAFVKVTANKLTTLYGALALNLFYWFVAPAWLASVGEMSGVTVPAWFAWAIRLGVAGLTIIWIVRSYRKEPRFVTQLMPSSEKPHISSTAARALQQAVRSAQAEVTVMPQEQRVLVEPGRTLLEIAEKNELPIEAGCRMGVCGSDPIVILAGMEHLSDLQDEERSTLERLGCGENVRMGCMARVHGPVTVSLDRRLAKPALVKSRAAAFDPTIKQIVIVGNGIAGVTAADYVRRYHPTCAIDLIGRESHHLYNRMAISRLIYGRSAMNGLYLQPDAWYAERKITAWLNTQVASIDPLARTVLLAMGETLPYDRLILACGGSSAVPSLFGFGIGGTFVLREAHDSIQIRAFAQTHGCRRAVIIGGGLLGLEAGYALHKLGLHVTVLERSSWPLRRQLDERSSHFLRQYLEGLGMDIVVNAEASSVVGAERVRKVVLRDGRTLDCDLLLACVGVASNVELAETIGVRINRGVVVDERMATTTPGVYAAGDVCEYQGQVHGLWPMAVEQAKVAALNAVGGSAVYTPAMPVTTLKIAGVDLTSIGCLDEQNGDALVIALEETAEHRYRKLVIAHDRIVGAILLGYPLEAPVVTEAIKQGIDVRADLDELRAGAWAMLQERVAAGAAQAVNQ